MLVSSITTATLLTCALAASSQQFVPPSTSPFSQSANYVGRNNGTLPQKPLVPGAQFDRFVQIFLENTDYKTAASSPVFKALATKGVVLTNFDAITHPSQPNYVAVVSGDTQGVRSDDNSWYQNPPIDPSVETIVDLLESKSISWATYAENMPTDGFRGRDYSSKSYTSGRGNYKYYVRRHNPFAMFEGVAGNATRAKRIRNFNDFAADVSADALPSWIFIAPNMVNDGHDTSIDYASQWIQYWLVPLLADKRFNNPRTLILLSFDESESYFGRNQIYVTALGNSIPSSLVGTQDSTYYNHYSTLSTVESNWNLGNLNSGDVGANVFSWVANVTGYTNQ